MHALPMAYAPCCSPPAVTRTPASSCDANPRPRHRCGRVVPRPEHEDRRRASRVQRLRLGCLHRPEGAGEAVVHDRSPEARSLAGCRVLDPAKPGDVADGRAVRAADREEGLLDVAVRAVAFPAGVGVGREEKAAAVAMVRRVQRRRQLPPRRAAGVEDLRDADVEASGVERATLARAVGGQRRRVDARAQTVVRLARTTVAVKRAAHGTTTVGEEEVEVTLEPGRLLDLHRFGIERGIDGPVEHERPNPVRELLGVPGAEIGPIRAAVVRQGLVAERGADAVEVARGAFGGQVREQVAGVLLARVDELLHAGDESGALRLRLGRPIERIEAVEVVGAVDGVALADATWIEADDVEPVAQLRSEDGLDPEGELDPRRAGATRVHDQRADPTVGIARRDAQERELDRRTVLDGVVQRHRERGALRPATAAPPAERAPCLAGSRTRRRCGEDSRDDRERDENSGNATTGHAVERRG